MKVFIYLFTGFKQSPALPTGMETLFESLDELKGPGVTIEIKPWWTDVKALARLVNRQIVGSSGPTKYRVIVAGYSYGGDRAVRFCRQLMALGIQVRNLFLIDAVWRPSYPIPGTKHLPSLLSMSPWPTFQIPPNVKNLKAWVQRNGPFAEWPLNPRGHRIHIEDRHATYYDGGFPKDLKLLHSEMDDSELIRNTIKATASSCVRDKRLDY